MSGCDYLKQQLSGLMKRKGEESYFNWCLEHCEELIINKWASCDMWHLLKLLKERKPELEEALLLTFWRWFVMPLPFIWVPPLELPQVLPEMKQVGL